MKEENVKIVSDEQIDCSASYLPIGLCLGSGFGLLAGIFFLKDISAGISAGIGFGLFLGAIIGAVKNYIIHKNQNID